MAGRRLSLLFAALCLLAPTLLATDTVAMAAGGVTTAWHDGTFALDKASVVRRSNIVLGRPNTEASQFAPLGNGTLGAAAWAASGFTAQLNRTDTFPDRKSPGWVTIPGLAKLTGAPDFSGSVDLYDGTLRESGGGMSLTAFVRADKDELVIEVTGADPAGIQTAAVSLWPGRTPTLTANGKIATLAESWIDDKATTGSGQAFGTLAAITAGGRNVAATAAGSSAEVGFQPHADGSFRVVVAAPHWTGGDAQATAAVLFGGDGAAGRPALRGAHLKWWHDFWGRTGVFKMTSADGTADYLENLRTLFLYSNAAESRGRLPGSHAGVGDLFNFSQDYQQWYPSGFWFWNLRMQTAANLSSGNSDLNAPLYNLYLGNLDAIQAWTKAQMGGLEGICVPETMRYNGNGYQRDTTPKTASSCNLAAGATWNGRTVTTGAEIGLWIWQQYQHTDDLDFLREHYPLIREAAKFLLVYHPVGADGYRHAIANAHETQWNVQDPTTDIVAMRAFFPVAAQAARLLGSDLDLAAQLDTARTQILPLPRTDAATHSQQLTEAGDASGTTVIADSYQQNVAKHNVENIGLEAVWPYNVVTDSSGALFDLATRTYQNRQYRNSPDWSYDSVQAARLGLASEVRDGLVTMVKKYQGFVSGMASWQGGSGKQPYIEQSGVLTAALNEALVQDYDGVLRVAPAWPAEWAVAGTVSVQHNTRVSVQAANGKPTTVAIQAGSTHDMQVRNPWPGASVHVVDGKTRAVVVAPTTAAQFGLTVAADHAYLVEPTGTPTTAMPFAPVTGVRATAAKHLGSVQIGLDHISFGVVVREKI
ncbi:glycosyl hydrolase family 95 catalytic domain-containing protein [Amycolatopsis sp. CA-126428]|uniref:glycosyl hydrolase family 95 catalytic domain-containing protein n=1 Tax=Amycolatopsis sp. CA-126428 TaxID=2073158 RepID=UPI000CD0B611|nr:glycoside hydrolase [Amycolatopsis sp. CA-126428]